MTPVTLPCCTSSTTAARKIGTLGHWAGTLPRHHTAAMDSGATAGLVVGLLVFFCCCCCWCRRQCSSQSSGTTTTTTTYASLPGEPGHIAVDVSPVLRINRINLVLYVLLRGGAAVCLIPVPYRCRCSHHTHTHFPETLIAMQGVRPQWQHGRQAVGGSVPRRAAGPCCPEPRRRRAVAQRLAQTIVVSPTPFHHTSPRAGHRRADGRRRGDCGVVQQ